VNADVDDRREPFGMAFTNREAAVNLASEMNRRARGLWFYKVERHIDRRRWIAVRKERELGLSNANVNCARPVTLVSRGQSSCDASL
jgi:hypothetical protein